VMEGDHCYASPWACAPNCDPAGLILPVWEYSHSLGFSITGGYVYHGSSVPELEGRYIYADYVTGRIWSLEYDGINPAVNTLLLDSNIGISAFGIDEDGELYICDLGGAIYSFTPTVDPICGDISSFQARCVLGGNGPKAQLRVILSNSTQWAGETVRFAVGEDTISTTIETNGTHSRALAQISGLGAGGSYSASIVEPANCFNPIEITCPTSAGSAESSWDETDRYFGFTAAGGTETRTTGLVGNSPNPFNPSTIITYSLGEQAHVTLAVYNLLGQEVVRLVDRVQEPGSWTATWNGRNAEGSAVSSGLYLYRLTTGSRVYTNKMLLTK
ncbi:MAG: T9SS type A sorting domain-containing protein, partial [Ignavibacteria bacterium]|nr:T9SS type A sorting domain-containing protein [Ignavibacteria bacterium]